MMLDEMKEPTSAMVKRRLGSFYCRLILERSFHLRLLEYPCFEKENRCRPISECRTDSEQSTG